MKLRRGIKLSLFQQPIHLVMRLYLDTIPPMRTGLEYVIRALAAVNDGSATDDDRKILKVVGGTAFRHGRFDLALDMEEVGRRLKRAPGIVQSRIASRMAVNKGEFDGHSDKDEDERPTRETPLRLRGSLRIGRQGRDRHRGTE